MESLCLSKRIHEKAVPFFSYSILTLKPQEQIQSHKVDAHTYEEHKHLQNMKIRLQHENKINVG